MTSSTKLEPGLAYPSTERYLRQASSSTSVPSDEPLSAPNSYESINWQFSLYEDPRPTTSSTTTDPTNALYTSLAAQRNGFFEPNSPPEGSHESSFSFHPPGPEPPSSLRPKPQYLPAPNTPPMSGSDLQPVYTMPHQNLQHDAPRHNPDPQPRGEVSAFDSLLRSNSSGLDSELTSLGEREYHSETDMSDSRPVKRARHGVSMFYACNSNDSERSNASFFSRGQNVPRVQQPFLPPFPLART